MDASLAVHLTRIGMICNFFSFFLVAPEVIGEKRLEQILTRTTSALGAVAVSIFLSSIALLVFSVVLTLMFGLESIFADDLGAVITTRDGVFHYPISGTVLIIIFTLVVIVLLSIIFWHANRRLLKTISAFLATHGQLRRWLFASGLLLFFLGNILQFLATF